MHSVLAGVQRALFSKAVLWLGAAVIIVGPGAYRIYIWQKETAQNQIEEAAKPNRVSSQDTAPPPPDLNNLAGPSNVKPSPDSPGRGRSQGSSSQIRLSMEWAEGDDSTGGRSEAQRPRTWEELQQVKRQFEERVLKGTHAERIRVETPSIVRKPAASTQGLSNRPRGGGSVARSAGGAASGDRAPDQAPEEAYSEASEGNASEPPTTTEGLQGGQRPDPSGEDPETAPGYVAFMSSPDGFEQGIEKVMEEIAHEYVQSFPNAPRVTVSLIVGGGVRQQGTFLNDGSGGVKRPD